MNNQIKTSSVCLFFIFVSFVFVSCNKYLDKKPNDKLFVPTTLTDLQSLLDDDANMNLRGTPSLGEASSDEFFLNDGEFNSLGESDQAVYLWQNYFEEGSETDWGDNYVPVYTSNLVLETIDNIEKNADNQVEWNNVKGSALFYRSYYFLCLLWNYAKAYDSSTSGKDPGIVLKTSSDFNVKSVRATNEECYQKVINDTKASIPLLPAAPSVLTRPSKTAAYGLLARCYLSMRDYKDALLYADSSLQLNAQLMDYNNDADIPDGIASDEPFKIFNKETLFVSVIDGDNWIYITAYIGSVDTTLFGIYDVNDLRRTAFYKDNADGYKYFKGSYTGDSYNFSGMGTDEMYLIRAEGYIRTGQIQKGIADLNTLLSKRYATGTFKPISTTNQAEALSDVLNERRRELVMRGLRWMDLKRLNAGGANITLRHTVNNTTYTLLPGANHYALQIPDDIIQITGMPQNPQ